MLFLSVATAHAASCMVVTCPPRRSTSTFWFARAPAGTLAVAVLAPVSLRSLCWRPFHVADTFARAHSNRNSCAAATCSSSFHRVAFISPAFIVSGCGAVSCLPHRFCTFAHLLFLFNWAAATCATISHTFSTAGAANGFDTTTRRIAAQIVHFALCHLTQAGFLPTHCF